MIRISLIALITILLQLIVTVDAKSEVPFKSADKERYTVEVPTYFVITGVGVVSDDQENGLPDSNPSVNDLSFGKLVQGSYQGNSWELTTNKPIGISINYNANSRFSITPYFKPLESVTGYQILNTRVYPAKIIFGSSAHDGDENHIFKFYPIVKVNKNIPEGIYQGSITFTVLGL